MSKIWEVADSNPAFLGKVIQAACNKVNKEQPGEKIYSSSIEHRIQQLGCLSQIKKGFEVTIDDDELTVKWV